MSSTLRATTSQPRNLLSMARLNSAKSRDRCSICSLVRIAQTCFCRNGGLASVSFPLFQGVRLTVGGSELASYSMVALLGYRGGPACLGTTITGRRLWRWSCEHRVKDRLRPLKDFVAQNHRLCLVCRVCDQSLLMPPVQSTPIETL